MSPICADSQQSVLCTCLGWFSHVQGCFCSTQGVPAVLLLGWPHQTVDRASVLLTLFALCRRPHAANQQITSQLSASQKADLQQAAEQAQLFAANPTTDSIQQSLAAAVLKAGSLAGMLQQRAAPLLHQYALPAFELKVDLAWFSMTPAEAQGYDTTLLQRINSANSLLFGPLPAAPARPVLLQSMVDLWCCDVDALKLSFAAPTAQGQATAAAATAAVLSALLSGAQVAQAMARGDTAGASRAAAAASSLAGMAANHVQQLQQLTGGGTVAAVGTEAAAVSAGGSSRDGMGTAAAITHVAAPVAKETAAALTSVAACSAPAWPNAATAPVDSTPAEIALGGAKEPQLAADPGSSSQPSTAALDSLQTAAAEAAGLATQLGQAAAPDNQVLRRGAGLLLLRDTSWGGKARQMQAGRAVVSGHEYSHYSVLQLMTSEGLLLQKALSQTVSVRVSKEYSPADHPCIGHWSRQAYSVTIAPGCNLLLSCQPRHSLGQRFTANSPAAARSFLALYEGLDDAAITVALGEQGCQPVSQLTLTCHVHSSAVVLIQLLKKTQQVQVFWVVLPYLVQLPGCCAFAPQQGTVADAQLGQGAFQFAKYCSLVWPFLGLFLCAGPTRLLCSRWQAGGQPLLRAAFCMLFCCGRSHSALEHCLQIPVEVVKALCNGICHVVSGTVQQPFPFLQVVAAPAKCVARYGRV